MLDAQALDTILRNARTVNGFLDRPVSDEQMRQLYDLFKWGPTSLNCTPGRFVFVRSQEGKEKLRPALMAGNVDKTMKAPVCVIVAHDPTFFEQLPRLFPAMPGADQMFRGNAALAETTAFRNGSLQGAYLILAARAQGLACGPMSGFDNAKVDAAFLGGTTWKSNFLVNLGYGDPATVYPRGPRLDFDEAARFA